VPVHQKEAVRLGRNLPVFFVRNDKGAPMPCLLLKTPDKIAVDMEGRWLTADLPDVLRLYPFGWVKTGNRSQLTLYPGAPHFEGPGEKLITSRGKPTQKLNKIRQALAPVQAAFDETLPLMQELNALDVLQPFSISVGRGEHRRTQTLWAVPGNTSKLKLSHRLRTLLYVHQKSTRQLLKQVHSTEKSSSEPQTGTPKAKVSVGSGSDVGQLIDQTCRQFGVTLDDLRSRKRSDAIKKARTALVHDAVTCDCLEAMAVRLERTVDTLKKWM